MLSGLLILLKVDFTFFYSPCVFFSSSFIYLPLENRCFQVWSYFWNWVSFIYPVPFLLFFFRIYLFPLSYTFLYEKTDAFRFARTSETSFLLFFFHIYLFLLSYISLYEKTNAFLFALCLFFLFFFISSLIYLPLRKDKYFQICFWNWVSPSFIHSVSFLLFFFPIYLFLLSYISL